MMILVIGGSGSGKSQRAESLVQQLCGEQETSALFHDAKTGCETSFDQRDSKHRKIYLATMIAYGEEGLQRVERHKQLRQGKGFETIERPLFLEQLEVPKDAVVLLEDVPNLVANEMFEKDGRCQTCLEVIKEGILHLRERAKHLVVVTGNVSEDGCLFEGDMKQYIDVLNDCNRFLAELADQVEEVVCGIPVRWKGKEIESYK